MPRFTLTPLEKQVLSNALVQYARDHRLQGGDALVAAASTTMAELHAVATQYLNDERDQLVAEQNALPAQIAAIDSALAKL